MIEPIVRTKTIALNLSALELRIWRLLVNNTPTMQGIIFHLYGHDPEGGPLHARNVVRSCISRINSKLVTTRIHCRNGTYEIVEAPPSFPKSTRRQRKPTLAPMPWDKH